MKQAKATLEVKASVATGAEQQCRDWIDKWVQVAGTFSATLDVQGTLDGTNWETIETVTAAALVELPQPFEAVRVDTTGYSSGTPAATLVGRDARTD